MHILITGMSGAGKSSPVLELRKRGYVAYDADDDGFSEPRQNGRWGWRADRWPSCSHVSGSTSVLRRLL